MGLMKGTTLLEGGTMPSPGAYYLALRKRSVRCVNEASAEDTLRWWHWAHVLRADRDFAPNRAEGDA